MSNRVITSGSSPDVAALDKIEAKAREQGVFVSRDRTSVTISGPLAMGEVGKCSKCKRHTADGNCYSYALCDCGQYMRADR